MPIEQCPSIDYVRQRLSYADGRLFWLGRPSEDFRVHRTWLMWNSRFLGREAGNFRVSRNGDSRWVVGLDYRSFFRSRLVWAIINGEWPVDDIDHKNRDPSDDHIENLRLSDHSRNAANVGRSSANQSGFKGVSWFARTGRWRAEIAVRGKRIHLGYFDDPEEAHEAYRRAADKYFGEFSCYG